MTSFEFIRLMMNRKEFEHLACFKRQTSSMIRVNSKACFYNANLQDGVASRVRRISG